MPRRTKKEADALSIKIFEMKMVGKKNKEIAEELHLHPSTVSTKLKEMREKMQDIDERYKKGELVLKKQGPETTALALPMKNAFDQLKNFEEMAGISHAGGMIFGSAAAAINDGFTNEEIPYEERMMKVMKGAAAIGGGLLSLYATFKQLQPEEPQQRTIRIVNPHVTDTRTAESPQSTPTAGQG